MADITEMKKRIAAMVRKSKDGAATESEALENIKMARKLADRYGITIADIETDESVKATNYAFDSGAFRNGSLHEVDAMLGNAIGNFCDCKPWRNGSTMNFIGVESDIMLAVMIRDNMKRAMEFEYHIYKTFAHEGKVTAGVRYSFMSGFASRIIERFKEAKATTAHFNRDHTQLVTLKHGLIETYEKENDLNLGKSRSRGARTSYDASAAAMGRASGSKADVGQATAKRHTAIGAS